jgi:hypothetical protein
MKHKPEYLEQIIQVIRNDLGQQRVLCFVGSGLSKTAGIMTWDQLLIRLGEQ